jgi:hypothetical protein
MLTHLQRYFPDFHVLMAFSDDIETALDVIESSGGALRKRGDMGVILECGAESGDADIINSIVFHGKNAWSMYSLLKKMRQSDDGFPGIEREFMQNINELRTLLAAITTTAPPEAQTRFDEVYLGMSQGTIRNLVDLAHDLAALKNLQNANKHPAADSNFTTEPDKREITS